MRRPFLALIVWLAAGGTAGADPVTVRLGVHPDHGRIVFDWPESVGYGLKVDGGRATLTFTRPIDAMLAEIPKTLSAYVKSATRGGDGKSVIINLVGPGFEVRAFDTGKSVALDIKPGAGAPAKAASGKAAPAKASPTPPPAKGPPPFVLVRSVDSPDYSRLTFEWPQAVGYDVERKGHRAVLVFDRPGKAELGLIGGRLPRYLRDIEAGTRGGNLTVTVNLVPNVGLRHTQSGGKVTFDVLAPGRSPEADAAKAEPSERPPPKPPGKDEPKPPAAAPVPKVSKGEPADEPGKTAAKLGGPPAKASGQAGGPQGAMFSFRFDWAEPIGAAVFRRGNALWIAFDKQTRVDTAALKKAGGNMIKSLDQLPANKATVLRMVTAVPDLNPSVVRDGLAWVMAFRQQPLKAQTPVEPAVQAGGTAESRLFIQAPEATVAIAIEDPDVGDTLVAIPTIPIGQGVAEERQYPELVLLATGQGVVVRPRVDELRVRAYRQGVQIASPGGLRVTPINPQAEGAARIGTQRNVSRIFDFTAWGSGDAAGFTAAKHAMLGRVSAARDANREEARMRLARFYFANGLAAEALAVLDLVQAGREDVVNDAGFRALRGAIQYLLGRTAEAKQDLGVPALANIDETNFWLALTAAEESGEAVGKAAEVTRRSTPVIRPYPKALKFKIGPQAAEIALAVGDLRQAQYYLDVLGIDNPVDADKDQLTYLEGRAAELAGDFDTAIGKYEAAQTGRHRPSQVKAALRRAEVLLKMGKIGLSEAIEEVEKLRFAWRGDDFEFHVLRRLGDLYFEQGDYRSGLRILKSAATNFNKHEKAPEVAQSMSKAFSDLYLGDKADLMPPIVGIALFDEFKELTPAGEQGDRMIRRLADRLAAVDLMDRATELLDNQVEFRLKGIERARVAATLALYQMKNGKLDLALNTLDRTETADLPADLAALRRHLRARGLIEQGKIDNAAAVLKGDDSREAEVLRAQMYWNAKNWGEAAQSLRKLVAQMGGRAGRPLESETARMVLNLAVALTLGGNERAVVRLQQDYGPGMAATPSGEAFRLIASPNAQGLIDYRTIANKTAEVDSFRSFLTAYEKKLKDGEVKSIQ